MRPTSIAFLAANPALSALLGKGLEEAGARVACFSEPDAFVTYLRIAPVDLAIIDADNPELDVAGFAFLLRTHPRLATSQFLILALTRAEPEFRSALRAGGVDLVLGKPVGATQLLIAADELDGRASFGDTSNSANAVPRRRRTQPDWRAAPAGVIAERRDNVIPLFAEGRRPR